MKFKEGHKTIFSIFLIKWLKQDEKAKEEEEEEDGRDWIKTLCLKVKYYQKSVAIS